MRKLLIELILIIEYMKSISVSENLHKWIMDHKNSERISAEKVIYGLIGEVDCLKKQVFELENEIGKLKGMI